MRQMEEQMHEKNSLVHTAEVIVHMHIRHSGKNVMILCWKAQGTHEIAKAN